MVDARRIGSITRQVKAAGVNRARIEITKDGGVIIEELAEDKKAEPHTTPAENPYDRALERWNAAEKSKRK